MELSCGTSVSIGIKGTGACMAFAKEELMAHLQKMFTKIDFTDKLPEVRILLSVRVSPLLLNDGYQIVVTEKQVHISSNCARGVLHGVYHLLRLLGCSFWFSKTAVQNIPTVRRKTLETGIYTENPHVRSRGICLFGANKKTVADVLATIDFMAKNGYNLLLTSPSEHNEALGSEHDINWDEISDTVLPHLIKRGIDICLAIDAKTPQHAPLDGEDYFKATNEAVLNWADSLLQYLDDKPYITMLGPWAVRGACSGNNGCKQCNIHTKNRIFADRIAEVRPDLTLLHVACSSVRPECPEDGMPTNVGVLLTENQSSYEWSKSITGNGIYLLERDMGDSYRRHTNLWLLPYWTKQIVATAANSGCDGVISIWAPISNWRIASINFALLREAFYHPDYSMHNILHSLCEDLWGVLGNTLFDALDLITNDVQDSAIWSRPPRAPSRVADHVRNRNLVFDAQNAQTFKTRCNLVREIFDSVNVARLDEHGRYHLDCFKLYIDLQEQFFTSVDQYNADTDTPQKAEAYFKLLSQTYDKVGEGFVPEAYARKVFEKAALFDDK